MEEKIRDMIFIALKNMAEELESEELKNPTESTKLYGVDGILDSLALVNFITDLEEMIEDTFGKNIALANERAMSSRNSPFKDVSSLAQYIQTLL